ncbi:MAG TPA: UDP-3-O-acyl-N-acetylglucosamine deacetylase [Rhizomicrobium sp.]|jgi:UDP-3-O-[3-hydroxymyristoyl] N-acetylglucosamine deacetylase|nr:UDP-3-O-acyl-N-acetylglucosamine deacetylase [Rhizomicrobium sp.]
MGRRTIAREVSAEGKTLHSGVLVRMRLTSAPPGTGVVFVRADLGGRPIQARYDKVVATRLGTVISEGEASVGVIEHLMAAVAGAEIDDLRITVDGPEPPILDGDARSYLELIEAAGIAESSQARDVIKVLKRVEVCQEGATAALEPCADREFDFDIDFESAAIGRQHLLWRYSAAEFHRDIAPARTFGFLHELDALNRVGLARGATLENTLAIDGDMLVNPGRLRFPDEFVRHKILDAIGDMALAGSPVIGRFEGRRSGHALNNRLLRALFSDSAQYKRVPVN